MTTAREVLRGAMPPVRRFWPGAASAFISEASAVGLLATSAWLIVRSSEMVPVLYISVAVVGVRFFALTRSVFRYLDRLAGHDAALRQLAATRTDMVLIVFKGLGHCLRGTVRVQGEHGYEDSKSLATTVIQLGLVTQFGRGVGAKLGPLK